MAPYEADAQLAYLTKSGLAQAVITEDSDLLAFGCKKVSSTLCTVVTTTTRKLANHWERETFASKKEIIIRHDKVFSQC